MELELQVLPQDLEQCQWHWLMPKGFSEPNSSKFLEKASWCARLGSGSASRSIYGAPAIWGETAAYESASDLYAVPFTESIHEDLNNWSDAVMIVDAGEKSVSSSQGHALLNEHAYANSRFKQAQSNLEELLNVLKNGDVDRFIALVESEALQLHSMMMSSIPYYMLMRPHTISIIQEIWAFRTESKLPVCFTSGCRSQCARFIRFTLSGRNSKLYQQPLVIILSKRVVSLQCNRWQTGKNRK